ncbi:uncharacterized protein At2g29880-like [Henckelia pumila]|uniref:uncharacterized protein At2g29880-like n=1 Tax=Henckelia pumila TaxID=405737 RepID=UPI003C6DC8E6
MGRGARMEVRGEGCRAEGRGASGEGAGARMESYPRHENYRSNTFEDYEDLIIAVGNRTAIGKFSSAVRDDTDARTFETEQHMGTSLLDDLVFDSDSGAFIQNDGQESSYQLTFLEDITSPLSSQPMSSEVPPASSKIESIGAIDDNCWDAIKEVPDLDNRTRFTVLGLLNNRSKKMAFLKMTIEERLEWINYKLK